MKAELSASEARRAALTAQGFNAMRRHEAVGAAQLCKGVDRLGLLQIDSVNILVRAQYLPLFSRLGSYELALLDALMAAKPKRFFEYWGHEASLLPIECQPLLRWRMRVRGWQQQAYLHKDARAGRKLEGSVLLSPFDPLIWHRPRTERLFGFRYRLEIYTTAHKREHGYYVLPFLLDGVLVARVDLKADRKAGTLIVQRAHVEPGAPQCTVERLIEELSLMASWLGLAGLAIAPVAGIDRLFATLHVGAHPAFAELAPAQSEMACYG